MAIGARITLLGCLILTTAVGSAQAPQPTPPPVAPAQVPAPKTPPEKPAAVKASDAKAAAISAAAAKSATPSEAPVTAGQVAFMESRLADWPQFAKYRAANAALPPPAPGEDRVVFFGASMTEFWGKNGSKFFPGKPYINRGISGQTTAQMVARFRQDVINLHPKVVVILGGTNDIAGNTGMMTPQMTEENWQSMADMAKANGITAIFASITPSTEFWWHRGLKPAEKIRERNAWLKQYCEEHSLIYLDYYAVLTNADGGMRSDLSADDVHSNPKGYELMAPLAQAAIDQALTQQRAQGGAN
jgi:lysophospholipase L1-like esterase